MKKYILYILSILTLIATTYAVDIRLMWDLNPPGEMVNKYIIYQSNATNGVFYPVVTCINTNSGWIKGVANGYHRFVVVANNGFTNAPPSNEVSVPTNSPTATKNVVVVEIK